MVYIPRRDFSAPAPMRENDGSTRFDPVIINFSRARRARPRRRPMEIILAKSAGFCMGVKRAIAMARNAASKTGARVHTYGPLIHNPQELEKLKDEGIVPFGENGPTPEGTVVVRAHGVTPAISERLKRESTRFLDATCPKVSSIQKRIADYSSKGYGIIIAGDPDHPEVMGLLGYARGPAFVLRNIEDIDLLPPMDRVLLVSQTTQDEQKYVQMKERFLARFPSGEALDTICSSTHMRQKEIREMVERVDAMVVIGGRNSANTKRLQVISSEAGIPSYLVESAAELPVDELKGLKTVGVTAGASTPNWIIAEVVDMLGSL